MEARFFESALELRRWLEKHHDREQEILVGFYKKGSSKRGVTYSEALDAALCFGWIDGIRKSIDQDSYTIRFSPRKPRSIWSVVNIERVEELTKLGRMESAGLAAFAERRPENQDRYSYERGDRSLGEGYLRKLRSNRKAWDFFQSQPPGYQRKASWWIMSAKQEETRLKRLGILIADSEQGRKIAVLDIRTNSGSGCNCPWDFL